MKTPLIPKIQQLINQAYLEALEDAYQGAVLIKEIEDKHFNGKSISFNTEEGKAVYDYFQPQLERQLLRIRLKLTQFRFSGFLLPPNSRIDTIQDNSNLESLILEKLAFINSVVSGYSNLTQTEVKKAITVVNLPPRLNQPETIQQGSFRETFSKIRKELTPDYEQEKINELRYLRKNQTIAIKWLLILLIIPIVVQITSRNIVFEPLLNNFRDDNPSKVKISLELEEHFLQEYTMFKEELEIKELLIEDFHLSEEEKLEQLKEKASEIFREAGYRTLDGLKNILADLTALASFVGLVYIGRTQITIVRAFLHRYFQSFNDATKVFLIILVTDLFVGYHSAEGWEVLLGGLSSHVGLPENKVLIYGFIATVPVIADASVKFWVFNYLTRSSPSAVAVLEKMNQ
ncbi:MAG: CemA family protein [Gomphosphaeria aponina SAG 52.96 = DSM 107014]|uniref:CemA family protein n=1 Tax=Gomphosphaeria aponina SAG 52.96 = DSM 107014 TaxID=1521640 RepID=A0A941GW55_9CHRO|nr:CemA family protein [Gomphosphaeria aponina SAG 52.96 = DSM 107014]